MTSRVDWIDTALWPGRLGLALTPKQKGDSAIRVGVTHNRDLAADLERLAQEGVHVLALLLEAHEVGLLGISESRTLAEERGLSIHTCPLRDWEVPDDLAAFSTFLDELMAHLLDGRTVALYSQGRLGRAGLTAACLLTQAGMPAQQAIACVREAQPGAIETAAQEQFVYDFAALAP